MRRAVALAKAGQHDEARALVERVIGRNPENPDAWVVLAQLAPTHEEAIEALREVLRLDPENVWARTRLERLTSRAGAEDEQDEDRLVLDENTHPFGRIPQRVILDITLNLCRIRFLHRTG